MIFDIKIKDRYRFDKLLTLLNYLLLVTLVFLIFHWGINLDMFIVEHDLKIISLSSDMYWIAGVYVQIVIALGLMSISDSFREYIRILKTTDKKRKNNGHK